MRYLSSRDIVIFGYLFMIYLVGNVLFPFMDVPIFFFLGMFAWLLSVRKTLLVFVLVTIQYIVMLVRIQPFIVSVIDGGYMLEYFGIEYVMPENSLFIVSVMVLLITYVVFVDGLFFGRKIFKKYSFGRLHN